MSQKLLISSCISIVIVAAISGCGQGSQTTSSQERKHTFPPDVIGSMKGVRLRVPGQYVFFPPQYEGEDPWTPRKTTPVRNQDSPLDEISILVLPPEMRPRRLDEVSKVAKALSGYAKDNPWIAVGIQSRTYNVSGREWMKGLSERTLRSNAWNWHYRDSGPLVHGLKKYTFIEADYSKIDIRNQALLIDEDEWSALIKCGEGAVAPKGGNQCHQTFAVPEANALVVFSYASEDLPKWREMQATIQEVVVGFVVERTSR